MICVSIAEPTAERCIAALKGLEMAEIRLDRMQRVSDQDVKKIFSQPLVLIATCRPNDRMENEERKTLLLKAIESSAAYVDVEVDSEEKYRKAIAEKARSKGCKIIVSYHDYEKTPETKELKKIVERCFEKGADMAKIACKANSRQDCARLLSLLDDKRSIVVVGMGEKGRITRIAALLLGSPFTFASIASGKETAEGQIDAASLARLVDEIRGRK